MDQPAESISTNSATALLRVLSEIGGTASSQNINGWKRWGELLDTNAEDLAQRIVISSMVHQLILPMRGRCRIQLAPQGTTGQNLALERTGQALYSSLGVISPQDQGKFALLLDPIAALTITEEQIAAKWGPIPSGSLGQIAEIVEDTREVIKELLAGDLVSALLVQPLSEALDLALSSVQLSRKLGVLVGVGPSLANLAPTAFEVFSVAAREIAMPDLSQSWVDLGHLLSTLSTIGFILAAAGFAGSTVVAVPVIATGLAGLLQLTGTNERINETYDTFLEKLAFPALPAGDESDTGI